jgi:Protein of unknown function (DUF2380)
MGPRTGRFKRFVALALAILSLLAAESAAFAAPRRAAVLSFELLNTIHEGQMRGANPADLLRLEKLAPRLREALAASGLYLEVLIDAVEARALGENLQSCRGCDGQLPAEVGADYAVTAQVQKVFNLILNMNIYVRDVGAGRIVDVASVDMRGDVDEFWIRALDWLVRVSLLAEPKP